MFNVISNGSGFITAENLREILRSVSTSEPSDALVAEMMGEAAESPDKINFTTFLSLFAERLDGASARRARAMGGLGCLCPPQEGSLITHVLRALRRAGLGGDAPRCLPVL